MGCAVARADDRRRPTRAPYALQVENRSKKLFLESNYELPFWTLIHASKARPDLVEGNETLLARPPTL